MSITTGTVLKVVVSLLWTDGNIMQNVFNAVVTGGGSPFDDEDIVADAVSWADDLYGNLTTLVSELCAGSQVQVYEYDSGDDDWDEVGTAVFVWAPEASSDQVPRGAGILVNLKTTDPDVSGKKYIGGMTAGSIDDGLWNGGGLAGASGFAIDWYTAFVGSDSAADWQPGIWSVAGTVFKSAVAQAIIPSIPAYQRRRKRGVGI